MNDILYTLAKGSLDNFNRMDKKLVPSDLILALLRISPVEGSKLQHSVFLTWREVFYNLGTDPVFIPSESGPYSEVVQDSLEGLYNSNELKWLENSEGSRTYSITRAGRESIETKMKEVDVSESQRNTLSTNKAIWDSWPDIRMLEYIDLNYPGYYSLESLTELNTGDEDRTDFKNNTRARTT